MTARLPDDEAERLAALHDHRILDTAPQEEFDGLVRLAASLCGVPIAAVSLIDSHRQWFKAIVGLEITETSRDAAFCAHTILQPDVMIVPDTHADPRFADNPLVTGDPGIRFYAGVPLVTEDGHALGSLCVIDRTPRSLTGEQQASLRLLARQATSQIQAARRVAERERLVSEQERLLAEREQAEAERLNIETERLRLAAIVESCEDAIYSVTRDGRVTSWNRGAERLYGYAAAEMVGRRMGLLIPPDRRGEVRGIMAAVRRGAQVAPVDTTRLTRSGGRVDVSLRVSPISDPSGRVVGASLIARDTTERRRGEEALAAEREFTRALLESLQEGIVACDADGTLTLFNRAARELHGLPAEPLPPERWAEHFDLYAADGVTPMRTVDIPLFRAFGGETVRDAEMVVAPRFGDARTLLASGRPICSAQGRKLGAVAAMRDVTERRQAERELARTAAIIASSEEAILGITLEGTLVSWNRAAERLYGYAAAEMVGRHVSCLVPAGESSPVPAVVTRLLRGETVEPLEVTRTRRDGSEFHAALTFSPIRDAGGEMVGLSCIARDVTARKRAEAALAETHAALAESEARLRRLSDAAFEGIAVSQDGALVDVSPAFAATFGYDTPAEMVGLPAGLLLSPAQFARVLQNDADCDDAPYETTLRRRDGAPFQAELRGRMIRLGGRPARVTAVRDISKQRAMEQALRESNRALQESQAFIQTVADHSTSMIYVFDLGTMSNVYANRDLGEFWGYTPEQIRAMGDGLVTHVVHPDDMPYMMSHFADFAHVPDGQVVEFETRCRHAGGGWRWLWVREVVFNRHDDGAPRQIMGTAQDVTERRVMEEALRESNAALRQSETRMAEAQRVAKVGSWELDVATGRITWSEELFRLFGMDPAGGEPDLPTAIALYHPDDFPALEAELTRAIATGAGYALDLRGAPGLPVEGPARWFHTVGSAVTDGAGRVVRLAGTLADITDRKRAEEALRESNTALEESQRFARSISENSASIIFVFDIDARANVYCNRDVAEFLGYTPEQVAAMGPGLLPAIIHPDDLPRLMTHFGGFDAVADGQVVEFEYRARHVSGDWRWVWNREVVFKRHADGRAWQILGNAQDVTERKALEADLRERAERLRRSEAGLRAVLESAPIILYAADAAGTVTLSEGTGLAALGLSPGEAVGRSLFEFCGGDPEIEANTRRALAGEAVSYDARVFGLCLHTEMRPVRGADGAPAGIIAVCMDVTERALAEERFRVLFQESSDAHLLCGKNGIVDCNDATLSLLRCPDRAQLLSLHPAVLSPERQPDGSRSAEKGLEMEALAHERGSHRFEWVHRKMDGEEFPVEVTLTPVMLADGPVTLAVLHDLTERKRAEEQIRDHAVVLEFQKGELEKANAELAALATTDGLTGLRNHRAFQERLSEEVARSERYGIPLSLILLDVDHFKRYNDAHGHPAGDAVLRAVARTLQGGARDTDLVARYGGEEFVLILPQTDADGAAAFAERLRAAVERHPWPLRAVTASFGVASLRPGDAGAADLIARADAALYGAKGAGRNRVSGDGEGDKVPSPCSDRAISA